MKLYIIGAGIVPQRDISAGAIDVLKSVGCVLYHNFDGADDLFRHLNIASTFNLTPLYQNGAIDSDNYARMESTVLAKLKEVGQAALLLLGHPRVGVTISDTLTEKAKELKFDIQFLPAISSFDTMINDIPIDPLEPGTLMIDSNRLLLYRNQLDPHLHTIIYHICSVGTSETNYSDPSTNNKLELLSSYLCKFFPPEHTVVLVQSQYDQSEESGRQTRATVKEISQLAPHISFSSSLFVPAVENENYDKDYLNLLKQGRV